MHARGWMIVRHWCVIGALMALVVLTALPVAAASSPKPVVPVGVKGAQPPAKSVSKATTAPKRNITTASVPRH